VDAQSVKNSDTADQKGYDAGKKVSGIKRHIAVDTQRLPHAITVMTAEVTDRKGALEALKRNKPNLKRVKGLLCDGGYTGEPFARDVRAILGESVTVQIANAANCTPSRSCPNAG
jgi:transposase